MARVIVNGGAVLSRSLLPPGDLLPAGRRAEVDRLCEFSDNRRDSISQDCQKIHIILRGLQEKFLEGRRARRTRRGRAAGRAAQALFGSTRRGRMGRGGGHRGRKRAHFLQKRPAHVTRHLQNRRERIMIIKCEKIYPKGGRRPRGRAEGGARREEHHPLLPGKRPGGVPDAPPGEKAKRPQPR